MTVISRGIDGVNGNLSLCMYTDDDGTTGTFSVMHVNSMWLQESRWRTTMASLLTMRHIRRLLRTENRPAKQMRRARQPVRHPLL